MKTDRPARRGYLLVELLYTLGLLGTFGLIASHLFVASMKLMQQNGPSIEVPIRFDAAVKTLRADMAGASSVELQNGHSLIVHDNASKSIHWQLDANEISRDADNNRRTWDVGQLLEMKQDGAMLLLGASGVADDPAAIAFAAESQNLQVTK